jgi:polyisoprenyl-phosphate glycosyltransferase
MHLIITMPVYEDWESALKLCENLDVVFQNHVQLRLHIVLIDDGSASSFPFEIPLRLDTIDKVSVLVLRRNLGHQRAIAIALAYIQQHYRSDALAVMDADGEDRPDDLPRMLEAMEGTGGAVAVIAERGKRLEKAAFRWFYVIYGWLHKLLVGRDIRFGNFTLMPWGHIERLVAYPELWNHYAATIIKSRLPYTRLRCDRGARIAGRSRMDFTGLVVHGMSALFANQEVVGTRLLVMTLAVTLGLLVFCGLVVGVKFFTHLAIPGWATFATGLLLLMVGQSLTVLLLAVFSVVMNRSQLGFLPIRDYEYFVNHEATLYSR